MSRAIIGTLCVLLLPACDPAIVEDDAPADAAVEVSADPDEPVIVYAERRWTRDELGKMPPFVVSLRPDELHAFDEREEAEAFMAEHRTLDRVQAGVEPSATTGYACFFMDANFLGRMWCIGPNGSASYLGDWNDTISSVENAFSDKQVNCYTDANGQGATLYVHPGETIAYLGNYTLPWWGTWNDRISSFETSYP